MPALQWIRQAAHRRVGAASVDFKLRALHPLMWTVAD
jgi:hypothetical protein